ncbi:MAG: vWA domain-containing protein [Pseudomonadota bacterium]
MKRIVSALIFLGVAAYIFIPLAEIDLPGDLDMFAPDPVTPNWAAIAAWPTIQAPEVEARPDPNRRITAIVLDDSGSMGDDIIAAKAAVVDALAAMADTDRVAVVALNSGTVLAFSSVSEARAALPGALERILSNGRTPLTGAIKTAQKMLEEEAAMVRGFGTFRLIVTTDGAANDGDALELTVEGLASDTPIQLTTIGIGIRGQHVLRRDDLGSFVDVANVSALAEALQSAVAENADFQAITDFEDTGG